jgi:ATP-dependent DNA ligase
VPHEPSHPRTVAERWEPERPGARRTSDVRDPIVEPDWGGARVVAAITRDEAAIYARGAEVAAPEELLRAILDAFRAADAVVAGNLTTEAFRTSQGVYPAPPPVARPPLLLPRVFRQAVRDDPYIVARNQAAARDALEPRVVAALERGERHAFVATDLLLLDGQPIDEIPLLERKRLLETILEPSELVRVSVFVQPSARLTLATWGMLGFETLTWRGVNSRYLAGQPNPNVAVGRAPVSRVPGARPLTLG